MLAIQVYHLLKHFGILYHWTLHVCYRYTYTQASIRSHNFVINYMYIASSYVIQAYSYNHYKLAIGELRGQKVKENLQLAFNS